MPVIPADSPMIFPMRARLAVDVRKIKICTERAGQRLDNFLIREIKGVPREHIYRLVRTGQVRVNSRRARVSDKLCPGDIVRLPPVRMAPGRAARAKIDAGELPKTLVETRNYIAFAKPAGLAVHGGSGISFGLIERLRAARPEDSWELAHRLDRETSGVLIVARRLSWLRAFHGLLRDRKVRKTYSAAVLGCWRSAHRAINLPLRKVKADRGGRRVLVEAGSSTALTLTRCASQYRKGAFLDIELVTGRTHQARAHLAHVGLPVIGDRRYGDRESNRLAAARGFRRMYLHALRVEFTLPGETGTVISCELPDEFAKLTQWLSESGG